jgi:hypothetical protein
MKAITDVDAKAVDFHGGHILYVEGNEESFDLEVLKALANNIWIQPLRTASSIRSAAESLFPTHPKSYFLIDRDHHISDEQVETYWRDFPDPSTKNLLVWRRKELENYFLEPSFLIGSSFCKEDFKENNGQRLQEKIISLAQEWLYFDTANYVIVSLREDFRRQWIEKFSDHLKFPDKPSALKLLTEKSEFKVFSEKVSQQTATDEITTRFHEYLDKMTGGVEPLQWGIGQWLEMLSGKSMFNELINQCFHVKNQEGRVLQGKEARNLVARELLQTKQNLHHDIRELKELIDKRVSGR